MVLKQKKMFGWSTTALFALMFAASANAGIVVTQGTTPTTTWSATPALGTADASTTASFSVGGEQLEQTFTVGGAGFQLDKIEFSYGAPSMTGTFQLYLWQMTGADNPLTTGFADRRASTLISTTVLNFDTTGTGGVTDGSILTFDLTGADEINLSANTSYVVAIDFATRNNNMRIGYTDNDGTDAGSAYVGGILVYNEGTYVAGDAGGDAAFSLYAVNAVPEPASLALFGLGGLAMLPRRRRA